ncbi:UDP-glucose flavonoid 3-O-glucosyltransferase 7-like [Malania oleifera]|uniref:UDP-glucose flavonoid 3-O-glucosyltransferase 7-like n=1 Tax=Malania oleifera TaxID=397392 RepID=UPI0025ADEFAC|nr:UDP-glucose flavonoid 3-O-glucosyltransferase 7-like [Malania oleifera]
MACTWHAPLGSQPIETQRRRTSWQPHERQESERPFFFDPLKPSALRVFDPSKGLGPPSLWPFVCLFDPSNQQELREFFFNASNRQDLYSEHAGVLHLLYPRGLQNLEVSTILNFVITDSQYGTRQVPWIDKQPTQSVVYISFGSRTAMSKEQIKELGDGLERSNCRFLWVLKTIKVDKDDKEEIIKLLGSSFFERTKNKGVVLQGWVNQEE